MAMSNVVREKLITVMRNIDQADELCDVLDVAQVLSSTEAGYIDSVTAGTVTASKAVVVDSNKRIDTIVVADSGLKLGTGSGTAIDATATEINARCDASARIVNIAATETAVSLTAATHAERLVVVPVITSAGLTLTLPAATGTGNTYKVLNKGVQTVSVTVTALAGDLLTGLAKGWHLTAGANDAFAPDGSDDVKYTMNVTTTGGDGGDTLEFIDIATDSWFVDINFFGSGTLATGFA